MENWLVTRLLAGQSRLVRTHNLLLLVQYQSEKPAILVLVITTYIDFVAMLPWKIGKLAFHQTTIWAPSLAYSKLTSSVS